MNDTNNNQTNYYSVLYWFLSFITCGIFYFVWFILVFNRIKKFDDKLIHPGLALVIGLFTCGIYIPIYVYQAITILQNNGYKILNSYKTWSIFLAIFSLNIINLYQIQELLNEGTDNIIET